VRERHSQPSAGAATLFSSSPWLGLAGLVLLVAASFSLRRQALPAWCVASLGAGLAAWAVVAWTSRRPTARENEPLDLAPASTVRLAVGAPAALVLAWVCWRASAPGALNAAVVASLLGAVALWTWAWWIPASGPAEAARPLPVRLGIAAALLAVIAIGVYFRFHRLAEIPPHPDSDHAEDLINIVALDEGERPVFFPRNTGQPPLPFYWEFLLQRVLGLPVNFLLLKTSTALVGLAAIPAVFAMGLALRAPPLALFAAALTSWSLWPTLGARRGLTFAWAVFPAALALGALLEYLRVGRRRSALAAGLWLGLGQYGYNAFKIVPLMVPVVFALALTDSRWKGRRARLLGDGLLVAATALLVFLPLLRYMAAHPEDFWYRALTRAGTRERELPGPAAIVFLENLKNMALAFHWRGDGAWINAVPGEPFVDPITGGLLLAGLPLAAALALRGSRRWAAILISLPVLTLASTLSLAFPNENPAVNRSAVAVGSVMVLAALPAAWIAGRARSQRPRVRAALLLALAGLAAASVWQNREAYFVRLREEQWDTVAPSSDIVRVMREARARGIPYDNVYLVSVGSWVDARAIGWEIGDPMWARPHYIPPDTEPPEILDRPLLFIVHRLDPRREQIVRRYGGRERWIAQKNPDRGYWVIEVPR